MLKPIGIHPQFLRDVLLSQGFISAVDASTFGSKMPRAEWDFIGRVAIPVPDEVTQFRVGVLSGERNQPT